MKKMESKKLTKGKIIKEPRSYKFKEKQKEKEGILMCQNCQAIFRNKAWRHLNDINSFKKLKSTFCPACLMIKNKNYEGEILINFQKDINPLFKKEMENLIINISNQAYRYNPLSRLGEFEKSKNQWKIFFTDNQLTKRVAKKIKDIIFKKINSLKTLDKIKTSIKIKNLQEKFPKTKVQIYFYE